MKTIIQGVRYDTEKATLIGEADNLGAGASSTSDFSYWEATLYVTPKSGRYFIAGSGGPMTRFAHTVDKNSRSGGSRLIPISRDEALEWAEQYLSTDVVEEFFGDIIKDA
jgi:hypothetical protein